MAEPPSKRQRVCSSAAQPASSANEFISFVSCPDIMRLDTAEGVGKLHSAIQDLMDFGAVFISATCAKQGINMSNILQGLLPLINEMTECGVSVEQPDAGPVYFSTDTSISFWSETPFATCTVHKRVDPDGGVPAHGFFLIPKLAKLQSSRPVGQSCQAGPNNS